MISSDHNMALARMAKLKTSRALPSIMRGNAYDRLSSLRWTPYVQDRTRENLLKNLHMTGSFSRSTIHTLLTISPSHNIRVDDVIDVLDLDIGVNMMATVPPSMPPTISIFGNVKMILISD
jgi:hypothetical protein